MWMNKYNLQQGGFKTDNRHQNDFFAQHLQKKSRCAGQIWWISVVCRLSPLNLATLCKKCSIWSLSIDSKECSVAMIKIVVFEEKPFQIAPNTIVKPFTTFDSGYLHFAECFWFLILSWIGFQKFEEIVNKTRISEVLKTNEMVRRKERVMNVEGGVECPAFRLLI